MTAFHPIYDAKLLDLDIAVFDLETTGLYPSRNAIIQMACVQVDAGSLGPEWESKVNPGDGPRPIPEFIEDFTGIGDSELDQAPDLSAAMAEFDTWVGTRIVAGHNVAGFDLGFIRRAEQSTGVDVQSDYFIDTLLIMRRLHPDLPQKNLGASARHYGLEVDAESQHDALYDTRLCAQLMLKQFEELAGQGVETFSDMLQFLS